MSKELRETSPDNARLVISQGTGQFGSDIITFSIPVLCQTSSVIINGSSDVSNWGAPLTWGCTSSACMDADNNCATVDYAQIRYLLTGGSNVRLVRRVLNNAGSTVVETTIGNGVSDMQASINGNVVTLTLTGTDTGGLRRATTVSRSLDIWLRNRG
jgi:hypothetical protein